MESAADRSLRGRRPWIPLICILVMSGGCQSSGVFDEIQMRERRLFGDAAARPVDRMAEGEQQSESRPSAPEVKEGEPDLTAYLRFGLVYNAGLRSVFDSWRASMERIPQVTALPDPRFTFSQFVEKVETRTGPQQNTFALSQTLPWFGRLDARGNVQAEEGERLWAKVVGHALLVEKEIRSAYFEYAWLAEAIRITNDNLTLLKRLEPVIQRKVQGGQMQGDLIRLQVEIGKLENELETLQKFRIPLSSRMRAAMNWQGAEVLAWPRPPKTEERLFDASELRKHLIQDNPDLLALRREIDKQVARVELAELDGYPDLTLGVKYIATGEARMSGVSGSGDDPLLFSVSMNLPIWRQKYAAAVREASAARSAAVSALGQKQNDLIFILDQSAYRLDDARRQIGLYRDSLLPRARQALQVTEVSYRGATADFNDLIDSQRVLLAFEKAYHRAVADYEQALAALDALCGGSLR